MDNQFSWIPGNGTAARIPGLLASALALVVIPATAVASPSTSATVPSRVGISWEDIVELVDRHPAIEGGHHRIVAARAGVDAAGAVPNPSLEGTVGYGIAHVGSDSRIEWGLELSVPLGWIAQRGAKMDAADAGAREVQAEVDALRRDLLMRLSSLFWNLVYETEKVAALKELERETSALTETVQRRVDQGEVRPVEATRVEVEAEKLLGELEAAQSSLEARRRDIGVWLRIPEDRVVTPVADLTTLPEPATPETALEKVRTTHPTLRAAQARVLSLQANLSSEKLTRVPSFSVGAFVDSELDRNAYGGGLSIELPLWNWNSGRIRQSESELAAGKKRLETADLEIQSITIDAQAACEAGVQLAVRYRDRVLPRARSAAETIHRTYQIGEASLLELIDARRTLIETQLQFLTTLVQAQTDCSRLRAVVGED